MTSTFIPVETILKVDEDEILVDQNNTNMCQKVGDTPLCIEPTNFISIGTQCSSLENETSSENTQPNIISVIERNTSHTNSELIRNEAVSAGALEETPLLLKNWSPQVEQNVCHEEKVFMPGEFSQSMTCNFQTYPVDEKFFLQFDYKTRNKLKIKQRRMDPFYRSQERIRQRTVMRLKRQDPRFRAVEREKGRYRMRIKRLDPLFRSQERERQRERMKVKRKDPDFREREREQQKSRLHVKRLDPTYKEKERAQDRLRMRLKRQNIGLYSSVNPDKNKMNIGSSCIIAESETYLKNANFSQLNSQNEENDTEQKISVISPPENVNNNARLLALKPREPTAESFHYKKAHILNFNFYNTGKEQWANHNELYKSVAHFSVVRDDAKHPVTENNSSHESHVLTKDDIQLQRKVPFKSHMIGPTMMKIKHENSVVELQHVERSTTPLLNHEITCVTSKLNPSVQRSQIPSVSDN